MNRLARRLGLRDAVVLGLGSMLGAGVFVGFPPAMTEAGSGVALLVALGIAGAVAYANAISSARLAVRYPESGGTYVYGRRRLGDYAGFLAGWGFVVGKTASCAAMALTIGRYLWPGQVRLVAVVAVATLTLVNLGGIEKTARATRWLVTVTLVVLATVAVAGFGFGAPVPARVGEGGATGGYGALTAAGLLFFAFAGYARIATLGEEVRAPRRTIPRAIPLALGLVLAIYLTIAVVCLTVLGPARLAGATAPLAEVVRAAGLPDLAWLVRVGAGVAVTGVLLSLLAGVGRTALAMARRRDLPGVLAAVGRRHRVPYVAEVVAAGAVLALVWFGDVVTAIGFSSFTVLGYYAITNLSALTLAREPRAREPGGASAEAREPNGAEPDGVLEPGWARRPASVLAGFGLVGCVVLAATLPIGSVAAGLVVLAAGSFIFGLQRWRRRRSADR